MRRCADVIECTYTNLDSIAYCTPTLYGVRYSLLLVGYKPVQYVTVMNTVGNCNTVVLYYIIFYYITLLCYVMLCYIMLYYVILYYIISYHIIYHIISYHMI
jgi:hypothetical protein